MKYFWILMAITATLTGCAGNPYSSYYKPVPENPLSFAHVLPASKPITIVRGSGDIKKDADGIYENGYGVIGAASFVGPLNNGTGALVQAKKVGAEIVVISQKYRNTASGVIPITTPTATTSYNNGSVSAFGSGGGMVNGFYNGTTTTYGSETNYIPYSVERYEQYALFGAPLSRQGLGFSFRSLSSEMRASIETNKGVLVAAVRKDSPAFNADILAGDVVTKINGKNVYDIETFHNAVLASKGGENTIILLRHGKQITKKITVSDEGW